MDVILQGLVLMGFGMGFVYAFLALLIVVTKVSMMRNARNANTKPMPKPISTRPCKITSIVFLSFENQFMK